MKPSPFASRCLAVLVIASLVGTLAQAEVLAPKKGKGGSVVQGTAGTQGAQGAAADLETCAKPMGAIAVVEPQDYMMSALSSYNLQSPVGLIRMMIQQSNCFIVVERGQGMQNLAQERALGSDGQLRSGSNVGGGQMVTADFVLTPAVVFQEKDAGRIGGAIGGLLGGRNSAVGAVLGGLKFQEAQTSMLVADARSSVQVASAEGSARKADLGLGAAVFGRGGAAGGLGGYANTNEGKLIAASFADNFNNIVRVIRNDPSLQRNVGTLAQEAASGGTTKAGAVFNEGDAVRSRIAGVKLMSSAGESGSVVATLDKGEELIVTGDDKNGWLPVESGKGSGWVKKILVSK